MEVMSIEVEERKKEEQMLGSYHIRFLHCRALFHIIEELLMYSLSEKLIIKFWGVCLSYKVQTSFPSMNRLPIFTDGGKC